jgi:hypothetical protein
MRVDVRAADVGTWLVLWQGLGEGDQSEVLVIDLDANRSGLFGHLVQGAKRVFEGGTRA